MFLRDIFDFFALGMLFHKILFFNYACVPIFYFGRSLLLRIYLLRAFFDSISLIISVNQKTVYKPVVNLQSVRD